MKILVVKTSSMGDIIHALPVTVDIRENLPDAEVHWLSEESFREIPALSPVVSKVHVCAFRRWRKNVFSAQTLAEVRALRAALAAERYDVVIPLPFPVSGEAFSTAPTVNSLGWSTGTRTISSQGHGSFKYTPGFKEEEVSTILPNLVRIPSSPGPTSAIPVDSQSTRSHALIAGSATRQKAP